MLAQFLLRHASRLARLLQTFPQPLFIHSLIILVAGTKIKAKLVLNG
jgi:hypothetical protein